MSDAKAPDPPEKKKRPAAKRSRRHRFFHWLGHTGLSLVLIAGLILAAAGLYLRDRPLPAPAWLQDRIEARIAQELPQARVTFGEMMLVLDAGWTPHIRLRDIVVRTPARAELLRLGEVKATFAAEPLLEGQVQPRDITLSGVIATLRRTEEGRFALSGGLQTGAPQREAANLPQLVGQIDEVLASPALSALRSIDLRAVTLTYEDRRAGRTWTVDGARARLDREGEDLTLAADVAVLGGGTGVSTLQANYSSRIGQTAATFGVSFDSVPAGDIALQGPAFAWLDILRAPISGAVRSGLTPAGGFEPLNATLQIGKGVVQPNKSTQPIPFDGARSYFSYDPTEQVLRFDALSVQSPWITGEAAGSASLGLDPETGKLEDLVAQIELGDLRANPMALYEEPVALSGAALDLRLELNPFRLHLGRMEVRDGPQRLRLKGRVSADAEGWRVAVDGRMARLLPDRLLALWPRGLKPKTRTWLEENLLGGRVENVDLAFRAAPGQDPATYVAFDYDAARVKFLKEMPPVEGGKGHFSLNDNRLVVTVDAGTVTPDTGGPVALAGSSFIMPDVRVKDGAPSITRLAATSSVPALLSLLNRPPLQVMTRAGLPVELAEGQARLEGTIAAPLKKNNGMEGVTYHFDGVLSDLQSDRLVKGRNLQADRMEVTASNDEVVIAGQGALDGVPFNGRWRQPLGQRGAASALTGSVTLTPDALQTFGVALPEGTVSGSGQADLRVDFEKGERPRFALSSELRGLRLSVPQVGWTKPAGSSGTLELAGSLGTPPRIDRLEVGGAGLNAQGSVALTPQGRLERVRFANLQVGGWLDAPVDLVGRGAGQTVGVILRGGGLDLRRAEFGSGGSGGASSPLEVTLNRLQITDTIALTEMVGDFRTGGGGLDGTFRAKLNGGTPVEGRVVPQGGRTAVRLTSEDAGGVLRSAGLLRQIAGGNLQLVLLPVGEGGAFDGQLSVTDVRVQNAPGIAGLVNAVSVVGLINELNGDGIYFDRVEGDFTLTPSRLILTEGSAVGASMGLSMDGVYALDSNQIAMEGVITPVYLLNGIGSVLSRPGEGLIGFNYALSGPAKEPKVSVNPLSALAPGPIRDIFRTRPRPPTTGTRNAAEATPEKPVERDYEGR
ncbi:MAG: DUF3971 domain-containing protein [Sulfitobacter sp.]|nr:DUF3971 domain-containing protein [Sulfitobacter sp.]